MRKFVVLQDGSRLHYAIPRALQEVGMLERVYTDWYGPPGSLEHYAARLLGRFVGPAGHRMLERWTPELDRAKVFSNPLHALRHHTSRKRFASDWQFYEWSSEQMAKWVLRKGFGGANGVFGFIGNIHPMLLEEATHRGLLTVADQMIAPVAVEAHEARIQQERFPDWEDPPDERDLERVMAFEARTWATSARITCASDYVKSGLIAQGVPASKVSVIPYPIDCTHYPAGDRQKRTGPVTVGFVGAVNLRKGAPYFLEVARQLKGQDIRFVMVGPIRVKPKAEALLREHVELVGSVSRAEIVQWLHRFDIFLFPSTCEGSAGAIMEAMSTGLPVICTPNSGSLVKSGETGYVCAYDDTRAIADFINNLGADRSRAMGAAARQLVAAWGTKRYGTEFARALETAVARA
jgi:glycosyltransferase involved in cell wall biosynthesis